MKIERVSAYISRKKKEKKNQGRIQTDEMLSANTRTPTQPRFHLPLGRNRDPGAARVRGSGLILKPLERKHPEAKRPTGVTSIRLTHRVESMRFQHAAPGPITIQGPVQTDVD